MPQICSVMYLLPMRSNTYDNILIQFVFDIKELRLLETKNVAITETLQVIFTFHSIPQRLAKSEAKKKTNEKMGIQLLK